MKIIYLYLLVAFSTIFTTSGQENNITLKTDQYDFLIGRKYVDPSELEGFTRHSSSWTTEKNGKMYGVSFFKTDDIVIMTTEHRYILGSKSPIDKEGLDMKSDSQHEKKIMDLLITSKDYDSCRGCLLSGKKKFQIITFHPIGEAQSRENIIASYKINIKTGKLKKTKHETYKTSRFPTKIL